MANLKPQTLRGFNDWFAPDVKLREFVINIFKEVFEKYGYEPLETPSLEYTQFMLGISGAEAEKQFYRFKDPGGRDVMLRFEVMTSMCRAVASNINNISLPYKRYQIQPVWRAENTQKGRYRQFTQCDADTIGTSSMLADAEFIQMGLEILSRLGFKKYFAKISSRKFIDALRDYLNIPEDKFYGMCMAIDKLAKIGIDKVRQEMIEIRQIDPTQVDQILSLIDTTPNKDLTNYQIIDKFKDTIGKSEAGTKALDELKQIFDYLALCQIDPQLYRFDTSLARGLASYTGPVWEFEVVDGDVGSVAGCGRYDNLIGRYLNSKTIIPATGGSFGIERLCEIIKDQKLIDLGTTKTQVLVTIFSPDYQDNSLSLANILRSKNLNSLLYPDIDTKLSKQFKYASDKGIPYTIVIGPDEATKNTYTLKNMSTGDQVSLNLADLISQLTK